MRRLSTLLLLALLTSGALYAQDDRERLGPADNPDADWARGPHPLEAIYARAHAELRPELRGVHPRVYVTEEGIEALRARARTTHRDVWQRALAGLHPLHHDPPAPPAQERRVQNRVGIAIAEAALAYKVEGDREYLDAALRFMDAAASYDVWGYTYNKPDVDLAAGHLLYGMGWGYDLLYHDLDAERRAAYRDKLIRQARVLYEYYRIQPGRSYSYSQNHVFIPMAGLGVAAYALWDETEEATDWARLARTLYDRVLATYSPDGYYYEGFEYWVFATPWPFHYLDAHAHATGEDLWEAAPGFRHVHRYVAHSMLPDGQNVFDFGDTFEGALTRLRTGEDHRRTHPGGRFHTNYNLLYRLASRFQDPEIQGVAAWLRGFDQVSMEDVWTLLWLDADLPAQSMEEMTPWHHFEDHGVVFWRTGWTPEATAFAFKAGPPEGHDTARLIRAFPDWHLELGHAHPDANSFIIYANGQYLSGDTGWTGIPLTAHHNTVLVDGRGQAREGEGHNVFHGVDYDRLNQIRIVEVELSEDGARVVGDATSAYEPEVGVERFVRAFTYADGRFVVEDELVAERPSRFTVLVHGDEHVACAVERSCRVGRGDAALRVSVATPEEVDLRVEPNYVTAPGDPGAVTEGERQRRGLRLAVSNREPARAATFRIRLDVEGGGE